MRSLRLIVHADDFGLSRRVNEGILDAHRRGILTSASLMPTGEAFDHAIQLARETPSLDIGVHLTLTEEKSVLGQEEIPTLLTGQGVFHPNPRVFIRRYLTGGISLDEIRLECEAQIQKVVSRGLQVSHLDGHQHLHMVPGIRRIVGELARKHAVPAIRYPRERLRGYMLRDCRNWMRTAEMFVLNLFCGRADVRDAKRPDHFVGFVFGGNLTKDNLVTLLKHLPEAGTCELMCHPGLFDPHSARFHWGYRWQEELDALVDIDIQRLVKDEGIALISYATVAAMR